MRVDRFVNAQRVQTFRLSELTPEQRLVLALDLDQAARRRLELKNLADLELRNLTERELVLLEHGTQGDLGALHLGLNLPAPARILSARFNRHGVDEALPQQVQRRLRNDD